MAQELQDDQQINVELSEEMAEGVYANLAMIAHSHNEFVVDFIRLLPGVAKAKVKSRVVISPDHAKRLLFALKDNIARFEEAYGPIELRNEGQEPFQYPTGMRGPGGQA